MTVHQTKIWHVRSSILIVYFSSQLVTVRKLFNGFYWDLDRPGTFDSYTTLILLSRVTLLPFKKKKIVTFLLYGW